MNNLPSSKHSLLKICSTALCLFSLTATVANASPISDDWEHWWSGRYASGDWMGVRNQMEDQGISLSGYWKGTFYGLTGGGLHSPHGAFDEEIRFTLQVDLGKLWGLDGLVGEAGVRYRDGRSPNEYVGASSTFNPSRYQSGQNWRLMPFFLTYTTPELFGVKDFLTLSGGWQNAYDFFAVQPESKMFTNNAIGTTKGLGGNNGFPWSSSYAAWGGYMKVKPVSWYYAMAGLYMAIPDATTKSNHGLDLAGYGPDPSRNGLYFVGETGFTPKIGPDKLPGKYAFGGIYWGLENKSFNVRVYDQKYAFYWQADQMIIREPSPSAPQPDGKECKATGDVAKLSEQGLHAFTFFSYAPAYDNAIPFYFHTGLTYHGLIPTRDSDVLGVAFGYGSYSELKADAEANSGKTVHQSYEAVIEADYRIQVTKFASVQPFWQYIVRPNGTGLVHNANIFGMQFAVTF